MDILSTYGIDAIVRIVSHLAFVYLVFWSLQSIRLEQFFKKDFYGQIRMLLVFISIGLGYMVSTFFLEFLTIFRNLLFSLPFMS